MEEKDLRVQVGVLMCKTYERYWGDIFEAMEQSLETDTIFDRKPVKLLKDTSDDSQGGGVSNDPAEL